MTSAKTQQKSQLGTQVTQSISQTVAHPGAPGHTTSALQRIQNMAENSPRMRQLRSIRAVVDGGAVFSGHSPNDATALAIGAASSAISPVQRQISVTELGQGRPFAPNTAAPGLLSSLGQSVYKEWLTHGEHDFSTVAELLAAVERETTANDQTFGDIFVRAASVAGINVEWLEQYLTDLGGTLLVFNQETAANLVFKINERNGHTTQAEVEAMTLRELLDLVFKSDILSQSCGNTANLIHALLSLNAEHEPPVAANLGQILAAFTSANTRSVATRKHHYVKVEGGGHALIIEIYNDQARIFQSFFGRYSFAKNLQLGKIYQLPAFITKFADAMSPTTISQQATRLATAARLELFSSEAVHPNGNFRITEFVQDDGQAQQRIAAKFQADSPGWNARLDESATAHLKPTTLPQPQTQAQSEPPVTVMDYEFSNFLDWTIMRFPGFDNAFVKSGSLPLGTIGIIEDSDFKFSLTSKTSTKYRFDYVRS